MLPQREYLKDENPMNTFHLSKLFPTVNPENLGMFIPFSPFVRYPSDGKANQYSEEIIKKHFPGLKYEEALEKVNSSGPGLALIFSSKRHPLNHGKPNSPLFRIFSGFRIYKSY